MSTVAPTLDISGTPQVPLARLAAVEFRKALDTRAGRWFAGSIIGLCLLVMVIVALTVPGSDKDFGLFLQIGGGVLGYFLPIIIILLVTGEASQRNGLVTFTLEPRRSRVVAAKFIAGVALAVGVMVLATITAVIATVIGTAFGGSMGFGDVEGTLVFNGFILANIIGVFVGFAIAMLLMNTAAAIVAYFVYSLVLPIVAGIGASISDTIDKVVPWVEFNTAQAPLFTGDYQPSGEEWAQIFVTGTIWLIIPLVLGTMRLLRIEFK